MPASITRRGLIQTVGRLAGGSAAYATMNAMGLLATPARAYEGPPRPPSDTGGGHEVVILGAGIAGLTAAYELSRAGYAVTVLEANDRAGGRNRTFRGGDTIIETDGTQEVRWDRDPNLYFNAGPGRIPYHHRAVLSYVEEFGVRMEPIVNDNRGAFFQDDSAFGGRPIRNRQVTNDTRGFVSQLLHKAISQSALNQELTDFDREQVLDFVSRFGSLDKRGEYHGSARAGYDTLPGAGLTPAGAPLAPLDMSQILGSDLASYKLFFGEGFTQAATMMQPVDGMDKIVEAFVQRVGRMIEYRSVVKRLERSEEGARVTYTTADGSERTIEAENVIVTIPFSALGEVNSDFSPEVATAISDCAYVKACKTGFMSNRFWEKDDWIYGGISWSADDITQLWYPTAGMGTNRGVLVGSYIWSDEVGERFGALPFDMRLRMVIEQGAKIHATYADNVSDGASIAWANVPYVRGGWAEWTQEQRAASYPAVTRPDGPYHFAGEHISYITGWQEGAILSAHDTIRAIVERTTHTTAN